MNYVSENMEFTSFNNKLADHGSIRRSPSIKPPPKFNGIVGDQAEGVLLPPLLHLSSISGESGLATLPSDLSHKGLLLGRNTSWGSESQQGPSHFLQNILPVSLSSRSQAATHSPRPLSSLPNGTGGLNSRMAVTQRHRCTFCRKSFLFKSLVHRCCRGRSARACYRQKALSKSISLLCKRVPCSLCQRRFRNRALLAFHLKQAHGGGSEPAASPRVVKKTSPVVQQRSSCPLCLSKFSNKKMFSKHMKVVHSIQISQDPSEKKHQCHICQKSFARPSRLAAHLRSHTGESPFQCLPCGKSFKCKRFYQDHTKSACHLQRVASQEGRPLQLEKPFSCHLCPLSYFKHHTLLKHVKRAHCETQLSFPCPRCPQEFKTKESLSRHSQLHTGVKKFGCEKCGSCFRALVHLKEHLASVHSDARHFSCHLCKKQFKLASLLKRHLGIHTNSRPHTCHCGKSYKRMSHLKRHMASIPHAPLQNDANDQAPKLNQDSNDHPQPSVTANTSSPASLLSPTPELEDIFFSSPYWTSLMGVDTDLSTLMPVQDQVGLDAVFLPTTFLPLVEDIRPYEALYLQTELSADPLLPSYSFIPTSHLELEDNCKSS